MFPDLSVKIEGDFRLRFSLFEMGRSASPFPLEKARSDVDSRTRVSYIKSVTSSPFTGQYLLQYGLMAELTTISVHTAGIPRDVRIYVSLALLRGPRCEAED